MYPEPVIIDARNVLALSEEDQFNFWLKYVAIHKHHSIYLQTATERSKLICFHKWLKSVKKLAEEPLSATA